MTTRATQAFFQRLLKGDTQGYLSAFGAGAGEASAEPIPCVCPKCGYEDDPWINPAFTMLVRLEIPDARPLYGSKKLCPQCVSVEQIKPRALVRRTPRQMMADAGVPALMAEWDFTTHPDQKSPYLAKAKAFATSTETHDLVLHGPNGTGKTGLLIAIVRERLLLDRMVLFITARELLLTIRDTYRAGSPTSEMQALQRFVTVGTLVIDDVSAIRASEYTEDLLQTILGLRGSADRPTLMSTNALETDLAEVVGPVTWDRLRERCKFWEIAGRNFRRPRTKQKPAHGG